MFCSSPSPNCELPGGKDHVLFFFESYYLSHGKYSVFVEEMGSYSAEKGKAGEC